MLAHTKRLLTKAERTARLRAQLANQLHNGGVQLVPPFPKAGKAPYAGCQSTLETQLAHDPFRR
jgi:hypothetical protein